LSRIENNLILMRKKSTRVRSYLVRMRTDFEIVTTNPLDSKLSARDTRKPTMMKRKAKTVTIPESPLRLSPLLCSFLLIVLFLPALAHPCPDCRRHPTPPPQLKPDQPYALIFGTVWALTIVPFTASSQDSPCSGQKSRSGSFIPTIPASSPSASMRARRIMWSGRA